MRFLKALFGTEINFNYTLHIERIYKKLGMFLTSNQHKNDFNDKQEQGLT